MCVEKIAGWKNPTRCERKKNGKVDKPNSDKRYTNVIFRLYFIERLLQRNLIQNIYIYYIYIIYIYIYIYIYMCVCVCCVCVCVCV